MDVGVIGALRAARPDDRTHEALPEGKGWLYVETGGADRAEAHAKAEAIAREMAWATVDHKVVSEPAAMRSLWKIREDGSGIVTRGPGGVEAWPGWEDAAVPPAQFGSYLREFDALLSKHGRTGAYYGHFGDGCLHVRIDFELLTTAGLKNFRGFLEDAADLAVAHGGSLSGEHGDGQARAELLSRMYSPRMIEAFGDFKARLGPGRPDEPAPRRRPAAASTRTSASSSASRRSAPAPSSTSPTTVPPRPASRPRPAAASGSPSASPPRAA